MIVKYILTVKFDGDNKDKDKVSDHIINSISSVVNEDIFIDTVEIETYEYTK